MAEFVDTNVFLHFLLAYNPPRFERCCALLKGAEDGSADLETSDMVFAELVWFLARPPVRMDRAAIRERLAPLTHLRGLRLPDKRLLREVFDLYAGGGVSFIDAYNAALMRKRGLDRVYSYDTDFDRVPGIGRLEP